MDKIRVMIADDHAIVREGLRTLIKTEEDIELIGEAANGEEAVKLALSLHPDVILMDMVMPKKDGIQAITEIKEKENDIRILVLTSFAEDDKIFPAIKAGAIGYLLKDSSPSELLQSIHDVYQGVPSLHPSIALKLMRELKHPPELPRSKEPLTNREITVLKHVAQGLTNQEIAERLNLSEWTIRTHVRNILDKLHLANRTQATLYALREGIADLDD